MLPPHECELDRSQWTQVGQLTSEEQARRRTIRARSAEIDCEMDLLKKKYEVLRAEKDVMNTEWWVNLKKDKGLPQETEFSIEEDGRILMRPKEAKNGHSGPQTQ
jgi:hypothetical protein